jgi:hypothetical protein
MSKQHVYRITLCEEKQMSVQQQSFGPLTVTIDQPTAGSSQGQPVSCSGTISGGMPDSMSATLSPQAGGSTQSAQVSFNSSSWSCSFGPGITPVGTSYILQIMAVSGGMGTGAMCMFTLQS